MYLFTGISWSLLIFATACFCYMHTLFGQAECPSIISSLGWSLRDWSVWLFLMPVLFDQVKVEAMGRTQLNHYLVHLFKLAVILCSVSIFIKLIIDQATSSSQLIQNTYYYLPHEFKVFVIFTLFAHFFKFHWQKHRSITPKETLEKPPAEHINPNNLLQTDNHLSYSNQALLAVSKGHQQILLRKEEVDWIVACGNYAEIYSNGEHYLLRTTMKQLEQQLGQQNFIRIHRSYIVNRNSIRNVQRNNGQSIVNMLCGEQLPLGRTYQDKLPEYEFTHWH
ncbi:MAG: LytTR family transcriptional regulator [Kangiellaceae bacterium]|nr:LytTR family transcriptional regulator [Kangiellaceae bacterium]